MFLSAKAFFKDNTANYQILIKQAETGIPKDFVWLFKKNALSVTPKGETGYLRRSIITQAIGNRAQIGWRAPYAAAVNAGGHKDRTTHFAPAKGFGNGGGGYTTSPGWFHPYTTGSRGFAERAFNATRAQMPAAIRARGLTK